MKQKILIADDDTNIAELISLYLIKEGYEARKVHNGRDALWAMQTFSPDLLILDIMMPEMDGYEVCREVRKISSLPIIMLTAKGETFDKVLGLELGANDYMVKPFDTKELVARVKAVLRRTAAPDTKNEKRILYPGLLINMSNYSVTFMENELEIPQKENPC